MRILALVFILGLSSVAYLQSERLDRLEAANNALAGNLLFLQSELGGVSNAASALSGEIKNVATIASSTAASTAQLASRESTDQVLQRTVASVSPAVVTIEEMTPDEDGEPKRTSSGSGFFVRSSGYLVTNQHVVDSTDPAVVYVVTLPDGRKQNASIITLNSPNDIAVLRVPGSGYPTVPLGDSSDLKLGETVFAIGNALGQYSNSVSTGVISGLDRSISPKVSNGTVMILKGVIQTDAAINRGNSGGPLIDLSGKAVGMNVATVTNSENISFSIPINEVKAVLSSLGI